MGKHDSKLLGSEEIAQCTLAFHFEKPDAFAFTPRQSINLFLPKDFPGVSDDRQRTFSLVNAPHEGRLTIATRMRMSAYKQPLKDVAPGAAVRDTRQMLDDMGIDDDDIHSEDFTVTSGGRR